MDGDLGGRVDDRILAAFTRAHANVAQRISLLRVATDALSIGQLDQAGRAAAEQEAHKIVGSAGTFGLGQVSELARELETLLAQRTDSRRCRSRARHLVRRMADAVSTYEPAVAGGRDTRPLLLILHARAADRALELAAQTGSRGMRSMLFDDAAMAWRAASHHHPCVVVVELSGDRGRDDADRLELITHLAAAGNGTRLLVTVANNATRTHLAAMDAGASAILDGRSSAHDIAEAIGRELDDPAEEVSRVVAVDDDPDITRALALILEPERIQVTPLHEPTGLWNTLADRTPDLVILDIDMPGVSGLDLCRLIRANPRWRSLSVLFLSARNDHDTIRRVFEVGADDYITKPFLGPELVSRVRARVERARLHRLLAETDPLTALANRRRLEEYFHRFRSLSQRLDQPLSLAVLDVDHFKRVNDQHGHAAGDGVLKHLAQHLTRSFRSDSVVARIGGEEFVVAMLGASKHQTVRRLTDVLSAFRSQGVDFGQHIRVNVSVSAGVATHPDDGGDLHALYRVADAELQRAKEAGRDRVLPVAPVS